MWELGETNLPDDLALVNIDHAHLARHVHDVVVGDVEARRSQSVAVQDCADVATVGEREQS